MTSSEIECFKVEINRLIMRPENYFAHLKGNDEKQRELLYEHLERCIHYFKELYEAKGWSSVFANFINALLEDAEPEEEQLFNELLVNVIAFHDIGKINPEFQRKMMKNLIQKSASIDCLQGSKHSLLSAAVYIDYFLARIEQSGLPKEKKERLHVLVLVNAYVISRHHSDLSSFDVFREEFADGGNLFNIFQGIKAGKFSDVYKGMFYQGTPELCNLFKKNKICIRRFLKQSSDAGFEKRSFALFTYARFVFSILISCDYYATTEYDQEIRIKDFGSIVDIKEINDCYERSEMIRKIRKAYDNTGRKCHSESADVYKETGINQLRNQMFYEAEKRLLQYRDETIFYLEAPTGGGKSNIALNCSLKLLDENIRKIIYVYPFNTLVEQNLASLKKVFGNEDIFEKIEVVNSITPIAAHSRRGEEDEENQEFYQRALLDRQFMNYPFILTTHVHLFETMFASQKEAAVSFYQLAGSVIVLDEIQSYNNLIWTEMIMFLRQYSSLLNMKIIIMSATLPNLDYLTRQPNKVINLLSDRERYFKNPCFCDRVHISYELLREDRKTEIEELHRHVMKQMKTPVKILIEFIKKSQAESFYRLLKEGEDSTYEVLCMTGDDNQIDRQKVLRKIECELKDKSIILVATQVIEAGVDIDMDIGYKDISKLDSDEQFLGRINRNFKGKGRTYFFDIDNEQIIYGQDYRLDRKHTLREDEMRKLLKEKDFETYYKYVLEELQKDWNDQLNEYGIDAFIEDIGRLDFEKINKRMKLIPDENWKFSVFLARTIRDEKGDVLLDGIQVWKEYKTLLQDYCMEYAEKQVKLSEVRSRLNNFVYEISKLKSNLSYNDWIGELYCMEGAERFFVEGRLDKEKLISEGAVFVDTL